MKSECCSERVWEWTWRVKAWKLESRENGTTSHISPGKIDKSRLHFYRIRLSLSPPETNRVFEFATLRFSAGHLEQARSNQKSQFSAYIRAHTHPAAIVSKTQLESIPSKTIVSAKFLARNLRQISPFLGAPKIRKKKLAKMSISIQEITRGRKWKALRLPKIGSRKTFHSKGERERKLTNRKRQSLDLRKINE